MKTAGDRTSCARSRTSCGRASSRPTSSADLLRTGEWAADLLQRPGGGAPAAGGHTQAGDGDKNREPQERERDSIMAIARQDASWRATSCPHSPRSGLRDLRLHAPT